MNTSLLGSSFDGTGPESQGGSSPRHRRKVPSSSQDDAAFDVELSPRFRSKGHKKSNKTKIKIKNSMRDAASFETDLSPRTHAEQEVI